MKTKANTLKEGDSITFRMPEWHGKGAWAGEQVVDGVVVKVTAKSATVTLPDGSTTCRRLKTLFANCLLRDGDARHGENQNLF